MRRMLWSGLHCQLRACDAGPAHAATPIDPWCCMHACKACMQPPCATTLKPCYQQLNASTACPVPVQMALKEDSAISKDRESLPEYVLRFHPPLVIHNVLPCPITVSLHDNRPGATPQASLAPAHHVTPDQLMLAHEACLAGPWRSARSMALSWV